MHYVLFILVLYINNFYLEIGVQKLGTALVTKTVTPLATHT